MKRKYIMLLVLFMLLPLVSAKVPAAAKPSQPLDMVYLLVEQTFGSVLLTVIGMIIFMVFVGLISKMNQLTIIFLCMLFVATFTIGYVGALGAVLFSIFGMWYLWSGVINLINRMQG